MSLYHAELGFPRSLRLPNDRRKVIWTNHAREEAKNDRLGDISHLLSLHSSFDPRNAKLVEVESYDKINVRKAVYRLPLSPSQPNRDLVIVLVPEGNSYVARTVWSNLKTDIHSNLNLKRYSRP